MKRFKINWSGFIYGESYVEAETEQEAMKFAALGTNGVKDFEESFKESNEAVSWEIDDAVEVDDNNNEI